MIREDIKTDIIADIGDALDDIFIRYQTELGIESGDIHPSDAWELWECTDNMADLIAKILDAQAQRERA